jgi:2-polyprenyl-3-methyl-5-hydroxy-6-metoxy-1,4-benzoquinol methylase
MEYQCYGIDFDPIVLEIASQLAKEENVSPKYVCGNIADWTSAFPPIDIAVCFDIFEHLHDDELGSFLTSIRKQLSKE